MWIKKGLVNQFIYQIEIKGYWQKSLEEKQKAAEKLGYKVNVLYKKDIKHCFSWVKKNYKYTNLQELYDDYRPKYNYICKCGKIFVSEKKNRIYCSQYCSGKYIGQKIK